LDNNHLNNQHRTLNWQIFYPWHQNLTHLSLQNLSLEKIDPRIYLNDYYHLLTINLYNNDDITCDCTLHPFINWFKTRPPPLADFYEPLNKVLNLHCPISLFHLPCDDRKTTSTLLIVLPIVGVVLIIVLITITILVNHLKRKRSKSYHPMFIDNDSIALNEPNTIEKTDDGE
jgi:hypothetical protein